MNKRKLREVLDLLSVLHDEGGEARAWAEQMYGIPCYDVGRYRPKKLTVDEIDRLWPELFNDVTPSALFMWPDFALLHVRREAEDVIARAAIFDKAKIRLFPRQARFKQSPNGVVYERYAPCGEDIPLDDDLVGFIPGLVLGAIVARYARVANAHTQKDWKLFSCLIGQPAERAA